MSEPLTFTREILEALLAPFPDDEIEFLPRAQSNGKALGLAYIDARAVMRRLDAVVGPANWEYDFDPLSADGKMVRGRLTVLGVTKCDAGESDQEGEPLKSAVSDALKRAAVHFGIGRYLHYLPKVWAPYDAQKRRFIEQPKLDPAAVRHALQICGVTPAGAAPRATTRVWDTIPQPEPSGDKAAQAQPAAQATQSRTRGGGSSTAKLVCSGDDCGAPLTKGQYNVSMQAFGCGLCPACQKARARNAS